MVCLKPAWVDQSAICHKADQSEGNIIQDVVRAMQVLPSHSCTMSFIIDAMF